MNTFDELKAAHQKLAAEHEQLKVEHARVVAENTRLKMNAEIADEARRSQQVYLDPPHEPE